MEIRFAALWNRIGAKEAHEEKFAKLVSMYSEPQRFYHNMDHVKNLLVELDSVKNPFGLQPDLVELAIWYHDAIYNTRAKDNEERSAQLAYDVCISAQLPETLGKRVKNLILATKHDVVPNGIDARVLIDIDLSILGKSPQEFDEYEKNIRKEYSWVPEDKYREGRSAILKRFLDRSEIYLTDFFRSKYEIQARENIIHSMKKLENSSTGSLESKLRLSERDMKDLPEASIFSHWLEDDTKEKPYPEAGIGLFSNYVESCEKKDLPEASIFSHWSDD
nr:N-methyl-D-aspartate receptor NMDAR2C subunit [Candidatus Woesearchaeota archaeon]